MRSTLSTAGAAPASVVNRTHRAVRARAIAMRARRTQARSLVVPLALCSALTMMVLVALWMVLDQYDLVGLELPDATHHFLMLLLWFVPVSGALVATAWLRRVRTSGEGG